VPEIDATSDTGKALGDVSGEICLTGISFSYPARPEERALNDVTLTFEAGKVTALVGRSGSGKSSIIGAYWSCHRQFSAFEF
jgi:ATP-binding cassette subfamily B (MDR/TAP) protein 1